VKQLTADGRVFQLFVGSERNPHSSKLWAANTRRFEGLAWRAQASTYASTIATLRAIGRRGRSCSCDKRCFNARGPRRTVLPLQRGNDLCFRIKRAGWEIRNIPSLTVVHHIMTLRGFPPPPFGVPPQVAVSSGDSPRKSVMLRPNVRSPSDGSFPWSDRVSTPEFPGQANIWIWREASHLRSGPVDLRFFATRPPSESRQLDTISPLPFEVITYDRARWCLSSPTSDGR
jgi:hypothetical protein